MIVNLMTSSETAKHHPHFLIHFVAETPIILQQIIKGEDLLKSPKSDEIQKLCMIVK